MKNMKKLFLILILLAFAFAGCEEYLDRKDENAGYIPEEDVWADKDKVKTIAYRLYDCTSFWFLTRYDWQGRHSAGPSKNYNDIGTVSGEYLCTRAISQNTKMIYGDWINLVNDSYSNPDFHHSWEDMWEAVYVSNLLLDGLNNAELDPRLTEKEIKQLKGEAFLFRALGYFEISRRWGPMPYIKERMRPDIDLNRERPATFLEQVNDIVADCDSAFAYIPEISYHDDPVYMGRLGKAAALGLKSKALTTAASPNYLDPGGDAKALWKRAAKAAWDLIDLASQTDKLGLYEGKYVEMFHTLPGTIEAVWPRYYEPVTPQWFWTSFLHERAGGYHGFSPTQELIDRFETADGWDVNDPRSGYKEQDPYTNRDPRFYYDILYHGASWFYTSEDYLMDMRTDPLGVDRSAPNSSKFGNSETGYLVRKLLPEKYNKVQSAYNVAKYINYPYMRMAEAYLNYAEAVNEAYEDPTAMAPGANISAVGALNIIRNRAGQVGVRSEYTGDSNVFRERVRNEFYVELCFEYHLWFDQLRWKTAEDYDNYNFHGVKIINDNTQPTGVRYEKFEIPIERHFDKTKQYRYPLRKADLQTYDKLKQNPGW